MEAEQASKESPKVLAIMGPTSVGKTGMSIRVARKLRQAGHEPVAVIADAIQIYQGIPILSGGKDALDQSELEHRLISELPITETCSAGRFARLAHQQIDELLAEGKLPIVVGGAGLYMRSALATLNLLPPVDPQIRIGLEADLTRVGAPALHARLVEAAPWAAERIKPNDRSRIVRALELHQAGQLKQHEQPQRLWTDELRHPTRIVGLVRDRQLLRGMVDARVDQMLADGLEEEVRAAAAAGASATARKAHGFEAVLAGDIEKMKNDTRRYIKRQLTWMRKVVGIELLDLDEYSDLDEAAEKIARPWL